MIAGIFHQGSGLGNQLFRYVTTRVLATDKGYDFGMVAPELFKGVSFMNLDMGEKVPVPYSVERATGKVLLPNIIPLWEEQGFYYNPEINYLEDNTIIDGSFEDSRYWEHRMADIDQWLKVEPLEIPDDVCVIGFRGGEYYTVPELGLPREYYERAIQVMREKGINKFEVHTDDKALAKQFFPDFPIIQDIGINWRAMRYSKNAIIANSSFYVLPRLLNGGLTIAPRYWNRYNVKRWNYPQNYYRQFTQI